MYSLVSVKTFSTHVVFIFRPVVRGKRFSTHGNLSYIRVDIYKLECETDSDAGYYAGAVEIILTYHGESLRSKFAGN